MSDLDLLREEYEIRHDIEVADALDALDALEGIREAEAEGTISLEELRARLGRSA